MRANLARQPSRLGPHNGVALWTDVRCEGVGPQVVPGPLQNMYSTGICRGTKRPQVHVTNSKPAARCPPLPASCTPPRGQRRRAGPEDTGLVLYVWLTSVRTQICMRWHAEEALVDDSTCLAVLPRRSTAVSVSQRKEFFTRRCFSLQSALPALGSFSYPVRSCCTAAWLSDGIWWA